MTRIILLSFAISVFLLSCKKEKETEESLPVTPLPGIINDTTAKPAKGKVWLTVNGIGDSATAWERFDTLTQHIVIEVESEYYALVMETGDTYFPTGQYAYQVMPDASMKPVAGKAIISLIDFAKMKEYHAKNGAVAYIVSLPNKSKQIQGSDLFFRYQYTNDTLTVGLQGTIYWP